METKSIGEDKLPTVIRRRGRIGTHEWMQYEIVRDGTTVIDLKPALLLGWTIQRVTRYDRTRDWCGWEDSSILAQKLADPTYGTVVGEEEARRVLAGLADFESKKGEV